MANLFYMKCHSPQHQLSGEEQFGKKHNIFRKSRGNELRRRN